MRSWRGKAANFVAYFEESFESAGLMPAVVAELQAKAPGVP